MQLEKQSPIRVSDSSSVTDIEDNGLALNVLPRLRKRKHRVRSPLLSETASVHTQIVECKTEVVPSSTGSRPLKAGSSSAHRVKRQAVKRTGISTDRRTCEAPVNWQKVYNSVLEMRKRRVAPVDTMGCERVADEIHLEKDKRFHVLVALMLSSQTKDTTNALTMARLRNEMPPPGLTLDSMLEVEPEKLNNIIYGDGLPVYIVEGEDSDSIKAVGFHNNKTRYLKATALILRDQHNGDIPDTMEGLMNLPGVGPKMAALCMSAAWGRTVAIGCDTHVHRITNLWQWHTTRHPEETRAALEAWLPKDKWHEINHLLVGFGQTICLPVGRKCSECSLSETGLCPSTIAKPNSIRKDDMQSTLDMTRPKLGPKFSDKDD